MNVLFVAPDYPPTNRSSSLRAYFLVQALADAGYRVHVVAEPAGGTSTLPRDDHADVTVRRLGAPHRALWLLRAMAHVAWLALTGRRFDLVVSTSGPFLSHILARMALLRWRSATWVADYRDLWSSGNYYTRQRGLALRARQGVERAVLARADLVTTVSAGLAANLEEFLGRPALVFHNGYEPGLARAVRSPPTGNRIRICHTGSLYRERSPRTFLDAFRRATGRRGGDRLELVLAGPSDATVARELAQFADCPAIRHAGMLPRDEAYRLQLESDYCLLLEDPGASRMGVLTGKVFEYLGQRRPVIAFGIDPESEVAGILRASGLLAYCGTDADDLEAFLGSLAENGAAPALAPDEACIARFDRTAISRRFVAEATAALRADRSAT